MSPEEYNRQREIEMLKLWNAVFLLKYKPNKSNPTVLAGVHADSAVARARSKFAVDLTTTPRPV